MEVSLAKLISGLAVTQFPLNIVATSDLTLIPSAALGNGVHPPGTIQQIASWKNITGGKANPKELYVVLIGANDGINAGVNDITPGAPTQINESLLALGVVERYQWIIGNLTAAGELLVLRNFENVTSAHQHVSQYAMIDVQVPRTLFLVYTQI